MAAGGPLGKVVTLSLTALASLAAAGLDAHLDAQVSFNGSELQVNSYTTSHQGRPAIAADGQGKAIVVWESYGSGGTDTNYSSIQMRRFDRYGRPIDEDTQVNVYTPYWQAEPAVAADAAGNFVVVWMSWGSEGLDTSDWSIQARLYSADGAPLGGEFLVNTYTDGPQIYPSVARTDQGEFVVAWQLNMYGTGPSSTIRAQRFSGGGTPLGAELQVPSYSTRHQLRPSVSVDAVGDFVVSWTSEGSGGSDTDGSSIQARCFSANGTPRGDDFQVNSYSTGYQFYPSVAMAPTGDFVVAWEGPGSGFDDGLSILARRFDATCSPGGDEFQVNTYTTDAQHQAQVSHDPTGGFIVTWTSTGSTGTDTSYTSVMARQFRADGSPKGSDVQVNTYTTGRQHEPALATDREGNFVIAWGSFGSNGSDLDSYGILAQRFDSLFRDGFESGDSGRWSAAVP